MLITQNSPQINTITFAPLTNMKLKLVPPFALLLAAVLFSAIPCACALSEDEVISSRKKTNPSSSHLLKIRHETVVNTMHVISENRGRRLRPDADAAVGVSQRAPKLPARVPRHRHPPVKQNLTHAKQRLLHRNGSLCKLPICVLCIVTKMENTTLNQASSTRRPNGSLIVHFILKPLNQHLSGSRTLKSCLMMRTACQMQL